MNRAARESKTRYATALVWSVLLIGLSVFVGSFDGLFNRSGPNYREVVGRFTVRRTNGDLLGVMKPSCRTFPARNMATIEAALMRQGMSQIYLSLDDPAPDGTVPVRLYSSRWCC